MTTPDPQYVQLLQQTAAAAADGDPTDELVEQLHARYLQLLRGGQTDDGYPYPDPTDPLAEGADAIRALAEALAKRTVTLLPNDSKAPADALSTYPIGISLMVLTTAGGAAWPSRVSSTLVTIRRSDGQSGAQMLFANRSAAAQAFYRNSTSTTWSPWASFFPTFGSTSFGSVATGATSTSGVTFASGAFAAPPVVQLTSGSSRITVATSNVTATGFTLSASNWSPASAAAFSVLWSAEPDPASAVTGLLTAAAAAATVTVTCTTEGCDNAGIPIPMPATWTDDDGVEHPIDQYECGVCRADLTGSLQQIPEPS